MNGIKKIVISSLTGLLLIGVLIMPVLLPLPALAQTYPLDPGDNEVANALDYLRDAQQSDGSIGGFEVSAWVIMALAAAGEDPGEWDAGGDSIVDYLAANAASATSLMDFERTILAIVAAGENPASFGGINFVAELEAYYDGDQIGDDALLNDDFWGVLALISAGKSSDYQIIENSVTFIMDNQNNDGGWSWGVGQDSDVDDTAAAVMALIAAGESPGSGAIAEALAYIQSTQIDIGGFQSWGATNTATNSWAIDAIVAAGEDPTSNDWTQNDNTPFDDLLSFQNGDHSFNWQHETASNKVLMTAYALTALLGMPYPVSVLEPAEDVSVYIRLEGQDTTTWNGNVTVGESTIIDDEGGEHYLPDPTVLGALDEASMAGNFPYVVQDTAYGLYIYSINGEEPEGLAGWMYRVDYNSPPVGASDYILNGTEDILFYYGEWDQLPLRIEVDKTEVDADEEFTATVTYWDDNEESWFTLDEATVNVDENYLTDENGEVTVSVASGGTFDVFAEKTGFIRSDTVTVSVEMGAAPNEFYQTMGYGWNLMSTPVLLDDNANTLANILIASDWQVAYAWDANRQRWDVFDASDELQPLHGIYVYVTEPDGTTATFVASTDASSPPSRELRDEWNLIGPAPTLEGTTFIAIPVDEALVSLEITDKGPVEGMGYSTVVSPGLNQPGWSYSFSAETGLAAGEDMLPFRGYWVYMQNRDTLVGFSTTPLRAD